MSLTICPRWSIIKKSKILFNCRFKERQVGYCLRINENNRTAYSEITNVALSSLLKKRAWQNFLNTPYSQLYPLLSSANSSQTWNMASVFNQTSTTELIYSRFSRFFAFWREGALQKIRRENWFYTKANNFWEMCILVFV